VEKPSRQNGAERADAGPDGVGRRQRDFLHGADEQQEAGAESADQDEIVGPAFSEGRTLESDGPDVLAQAGQDQHEPRHQPVLSSPEIFRSMIKASRRRIRSSLPMPKPPDTTASTAVVPRVPMPVKTAYTVP